MQTQVLPDINQAADHIVAEAVAAYKRGTEYHATLEILTDEVTVSARAIYKGSPWDDTLKRIGTALTVTTRGKFKGRFDSTLQALAIEEHGDNQVLDDDYPDFFDSLAERGLWNDEAPILTLNSCAVVAL